MIYNTIPIKNVMSEDFIGRFAGEDYLIKSEETKYYPSHIAKHLGKQVAEKMYASETLKTSKRVNQSSFVEIALKTILGEEIATEQPPKVLSEHDIAESHNKEYKGILAEKERKMKEIEIELSDTLEKEVEEALVVAEQERPEPVNIDSGDSLPPDGIPEENIIKEEPKEEPNV